MRSSIFKELPEEKPPLPQPKVGEMWKLKSNNDPFEPTGRHVVIILDIKEGWVRYGYGRNTSIVSGGNERKAIRDFCRIYHKFEGKK